MTSRSLRRSLACFAALLYLFLYLPLIPLAVFSLSSSKTAVWSQFTFQWYRRALHNPALVESTLNSFTIAVLATAISTVVGTLGAYAIWKRKAPVLTNTLYLSLITPEIVTGVAMLVFFQLLFRAFDRQLGMYTVVLAHVGFSLAYALTVVLARLRTFDTSLEEAALDLGATPWTAFRYVTLPLLLPGICAAALLCFAVSFDDYVVTSMVAGVDSETLPMVVYAMARKGVNPEVNAVSVLITVGVGTLILLAGRGESGAAARGR